MPQATPLDDLLGVVLGGAYVVRGQIGTGGMGSVYRADHVRLPKAFAVKVLNEAVDPQSEPYLRFRREAEVCSRLKHEHIVEVVDFNLTDDGRPYIVMELLEGEDLGSRLERVGRLSLADTARILGQVCAGLSEAHEQGVVHRDMKPQNIFLCQRRGRDDLVKLVDFGISKIQGTSSMLTGAHVLMGTPFYMSPEQTGAGQVDHRTDVYALGVIAYQMLTGQLPFMAENFAQLVASILTKPPASLSLHLPGFGPDGDAVILGALSKDPDARFQTVAAFDQALQALAAGQGGAGDVSASVGHTSASSVATYSLPSLSQVSVGGPAMAGGAAGEATSPNTLAAAAGERDPLRVSSEGKGRKTLWLLAAGLAAVLCGAVVIVVILSRSGGQQGSPSHPAGSQDRASQAMVAPLGEQGSAKDAPPPSVTLVASRVVIRLQGLPGGALCRVDGRSQEGNPLVLDRADQPVTLVCEAPGHQTFSRRLVPDRDAAIEVSMPAEPAHVDAMGSVPSATGKRPQPGSMATQPSGMKRPTSMDSPMRPAYDDIPVE